MTPRLQQKLFFTIQVALFVVFLTQPGYGQGGSLLRRIFVESGRQIHHVLPEREITRLAQYAKTPGKLGQEVGRLNLSEAARVDTFLRIAVKNGVLAPAQEATVRQMGKVEGLASLLSKVNSSNVNQARGHIKELNIGIEAHRQGGKVVSFGKKFNDGVKRGDTDLDVLLEMNGKRFAIESKAYQTEIGTDVVRADMQSLKYFCNNIDNTASPVFVFDIPPPQLVQDVLKSQNVPFLYGTAEEICIKLSVLAR